MFCNSTEPNKFIANRKYSKNKKLFPEKTALFNGGSKPEARAISLECGHECEVCMELIFGIPPKTISEPGQRMPDMAAVCTADLGVSLITHTLPVTDEMRPCVRNGMRVHLTKKEIVIMLF